MHCSSSGGRGRSNSFIIVKNSEQSEKYHMYTKHLSLLGLSFNLLACGEKSEDTSAAKEQVEDNVDTGHDLEVDPDQEEECDPVVYNPNPFAVEVVSYIPGEGAGFGQDAFPDIVLGPPMGGGANSGSLDVLSLGQSGEIVLRFDVDIVDGDGPDITVFENPFVGFAELGVVSVSEDGENWISWPCEPENESDDYPYCTGFTPVYSHPNNCIDATDPLVSGGDQFDLADIGVERATFVRIQDSGTNTDGGYDLDAVAVVNGAAR